MTPPATCRSWLMQQHPLTPHEIKVTPNSVVFNVGPRLDFRNAPDFRVSCEEHVRQGRRYFVLDLSQTGVLDSTGLGAIFHLHRQLTAKKGRILFAAPSRSAEVVIELTHSHKLFGKYPSVEAALGELPTST